MLVFIVLGLLVFDRSSADQNSLNGHMDDMLWGVINYLRFEGDSVPLDYYGVAFEYKAHIVKLYGINGTINNIHALGRLRDVGFITEGNKNIIKVTIDFDNLEVSCSYRLEYGNMNNTGGIEFGRAGSIATMEILATQNGESCEVEVGRFSFQTSGKDNGETHLTGDTLPEELIEKMKSLFLVGFHDNGKKAFELNISNAFKFSIEKTGFDLCRDVTDWPQLVKIH